MRSVKRLANAWGSTPAPSRERGGIEEDRDVDIAGIVEFPRAVLTHGDAAQTLDRLVPIDPEAVRRPSPPAPPA